MRFSNLVIEHLTLPKVEDINLIKNHEKLLPIVLAISPKLPFENIQNDMFNKIYEKIA